MNRELSPYLYLNETKCVEDLLDEVPWSAARSSAVQNKAKDLIERIRARRKQMGQLESFLQHYALDTEEGLALMCLAEALLRIPDKATADALIRDKMAAADWLNEVGSGKDWVVRAAGVGLLVSRKTLDSALSRIGKPFIREAMVKAMGIMGKQFVLGRDIEDAYQNAQSFQKKGYRFSYDMLGEGARTEADAEKYYEAYTHAIRYIGERDVQDKSRMPGISVKLSALHPRYEFAQKDQCVPDLAEKLSALCMAAADNGLALTVDAEEVDRLELSLDIIEKTLKNKSLDGWDGFGLALQAYQKRAYPALDELTGLARTYKRRLRVRLVKGAYWDTEIKRAQVMGLSGYPVFTRKVNTDLSFIACAAKMLNHSDQIYPMIATHNAHTVAAVIEMAKGRNGNFEFQRLHGMGESLFDTVMEKGDVPVSIYAPVGAHAELLPYLVRRLLENGANTSFVNRLLDSDTSVEDLTADPVEQAREPVDKSHPHIRLPGDLYAKEYPYGRRNSWGMDLSDPEAVQTLLQGMKDYSKPYEAMPLIGGKAYKDTVAGAVRDPGNYADNLGRVWPANSGLIDKAFRVCGDAFFQWRRTPAETKAQALEKFADILEDRRNEVMALCIREGGKTIPDALDELREAVDFCRYYANQGRKYFADNQLLPGPTGESNMLQMEGRGVFVCISPWNFPLAIFTGQVVAALMAGNCVIAKPAEQTSLIAMMAVRLMHEAGIPEEVLALLPGDGHIGAGLVAHKDVAGVAFTGSTEVAREINKTLANKKGPIVPLIAETGGLNAMIVDSSALPEQVVDDVILSAFGSAGQRCSALRILCLQEEIAEKIIRMLKGAMKEIQVGDPALLSTDVGPVIDEEARGNLLHHREALKGYTKLLFEVPLDMELKNQGFYFAPAAYEMDSLKGLDEEVFGPVLHVVRYKQAEIADLIEELNSKGYGLTFGVHSRIEEFQDYVAQRVRAGNAYVNRSMIGAVVGSQPFGGSGLSGTGPKAGGPHYLPAFATERVVSVDTTAAGGNASLVSLKE